MAASSAKAGTRRLSAMMQGDPLAYVVIGAVYGLPFVWLYFWVRRNTPEGSSTIVAFARTLGIIAAVLAGTAAVVTLVGAALLDAFGIAQTPDTQSVAKKAVVGIGIGAIVCAIAVGLHFAKRR